MIFLSLLSLTETFFTPCWRSKFQRALPTVSLQKCLFSIAKCYLWKSSSHDVVNNGDSHSECPCWNLCQEGGYRDYSFVWLASVHCASTGPERFLSHPFQVTVHCDRLICFRRNTGLKIIIQFRVQFLYIFDTKDTKEFSMLPNFRISKLKALERTNLDEHIKIYNIQGTNRLGFFLHRAISNVRVCVRLYVLKFKYKERYY
jgi:hypothetical protein